MADSNSGGLLDGLYAEALAIIHQGANGLWLPKIQHLALRRHSAAMVEIADWLCEAEADIKHGRIADSFSAAGLYRRAYRLGDGRAAQHLAMTCFNRRDMQGYRTWLRRAAQLGDVDAMTELKRFETRLPHAAARKIGRLRPFHTRDYPA